MRLFTMAVETCSCRVKHTRLPAEEKATQYLDLCKWLTCLHSRPREARSALGPLRVHQSLYWKLGLTAFVSVPCPHCSGPTIRWKHLEPILHSEKPQDTSCHPPGTNFTCYAVCATLNHPKPYPLTKLVPVK